MTSFSHLFGFPMLVTTLLMIMIAYKLQTMINGSITEQCSARDILNGFLSAMNTTIVIFAQSYSTIGLSLIIYKINSKVKEGILFTHRLFSYRD